MGGDGTRPLPHRENLLVQQTAANSRRLRSSPTSGSGTRATRSTARPSTRWAELGFLGAPIPEQYGGAGMDYVSLGILCEEMERADTAFRVVMSVHVGLNSLTLMQWGTEEQKQRWLVPQAQRREAGHFRPDRARRGYRRRQSGHDRPPRRRRLRAQRLQALDQPGRHRRPLPGLRDGRSSQAPQGHHRLRAGARHGRA